MGSETIKTVSVYGHEVLSLFTYTYLHCLNVPSYNSHYKQGENVRNTQSYGMYTTLSFNFAYKSNLL